MLIGRGRAGIIRPRRSVVLCDRIRNRPILAVMQRVIAAHDPLQLGKFADHSGREVGLGELHRAPRPVAVGAWNVIRQKLGKPLHSRDLVQEAAELGVKHPLRQNLDAARERNAPVLVPEKACIGEPRPQYALIARSDRLAAVRGDIVGDEQESRRRRAVGLQTGEIFLMRAHRGRQDFRRKRHVLGVDCAGEHNRKLDEPGDLVEQPGIRFEYKPLVPQRPLRDPSG